MHQTTEVANGTGEPVEVGTTGTINSLMVRELQSANHSPKTSSSKKKQQSSPVDVPCGASPRKSIHRRNTTSECSSKSTCRKGNSNGNSPSPCNGHTHRSTHLKNRSGDAPMLGSDDGSTNNSNTEKMEKRSGGNLVEVVDVKCSYTMSRRLKKLGFSKLSESNS